MAFNVAGTLPAYTVELCLGRAWAVRLACNACGRAVLLGELDLKRFPASATLGAIAQRAKCSGCGSQDGELSTRQGKWASPTQHARDGLGGDQ